AATLLTEDFKDTEDLAGVFAGYDAEKRAYDTRKWRYETEPSDSRPDQGADGTQSFAERIGKLVGPPPKTDLTLRHERCVWQVLRKHFQRYTAELVEQVCGTTRADFQKVVDALLANARPHRTGAICY